MRRSGDTVVEAEQSVLGCGKPATVPFHAPGSSRLAQQARYIETRGQFLDPRRIDFVRVDLPAVAVVDEHP